MNRKDVLRELESSRDVEGILERWCKAKIAELEEEGNIREWAWKLYRQCLTADDLAYFVRLIPDSVAYTREEASDRLKELCKQYDDVSITKSNGDGAILIKWTRTMVQAEFSIED